MTEKDVVLTNPYSFGAYNVVRGSEQAIRITEGCPNQCPYCAEPKEFRIFNIPKIVRNNVKIFDMNLLAKPESADIIKKLGDCRVGGKIVHYELICGIDYRFLTPELADALKKSHFVKMRMAWDWEFGKQKIIKRAVDMLKGAGFKDLMIFMICNWRISYEENMRKMELCKVWNVKIGDCWFDNQLSPYIKPIHWTAEQIRDFRARCRKHNQLVNFGIDPELREEIEKVI